MAKLCDDPRSVPDVAALLSLPLGVVRVLPADMADIGLVGLVTDGCAATPDTTVMERVSSGLRRL
jgi:hypothetical protein